MNYPTSSFTYDAAGNITSDATHSYAYDGEDRICAVAWSPIPGMTTYLAANARGPSSAHGR